MRHFKLWFLTVLVCAFAQAHAAPGEPVAAGSPAAAQIRYEFAIYFPDKPAKPPLQMLRTRLTALAGAPRLVDLPPRPLKEAVVLARLDNDVQKDYRPLDLESLKYFGRGLSQEQGVALQGARSALILLFAHPQKQSMSAYRKSLLLAEQVARDTNGLLWDEETREVFSVDSWHQSRLETWDGDIPDVTKHTIIHAYNGDQLVRAITLGMSKFGLPDVVANDFSWSFNTSMGNLVNLLSQSLVEGAQINAGGRYDAKLTTIRHATRRKAMTEGLLRKSTGIARLSLVQGLAEKGDPDNRLFEIQFDQYPGVDRYARQDAMLHSLFGSEDSITYVQHTKRLLAASEAARAKLPELQQAFARGLKPGEYLLVKAPFATPKGGQEWMWVEVTAWQGDAITGLLKNDPFDIPTLHSGQIVQVSQSKLFDYLHRLANGQEEGNTTGKILQEQQKAAR
jgi:uncharacterized protein YegJ (DUF2314 family)